MCAEYGLAEGLPFYAGGLGILAGDTLKQAADDDFPMVGIGLFYHGKKDRQVVDESGWQRYVDYHFEPDHFEFEEVVDQQGQPWSTTIQLGTESVTVFALAKKLNDNVAIYFLETDRAINPQHLRDLTLAPYWGDQVQQFRQQLVLGVGGVRLLSDMGMMPQTFHMNEGRPTLALWELAAMLREKHGLSGPEALDIFKDHTVYTNHTLVKAGNMNYDLAAIEPLVQSWADRLGMSVEQLLEPGREEDTGRFGVTTFGLEMSAKQSGVSQRHTEMCRELWPEHNWQAITNGVHLPTWQSRQIREAGSTDELWQAHVQAKHDLMDEAQFRTGYGYDPEWLVLGWARRITGYKRLDSLFVDIERLAKMMRDDERPVQLVVAGKAHPGDQAGKEQLQWVIQRFQEELAGHALFIPNYDMTLGKQMVAGVDIWLNTPVDGREACGTSGMKAAANGVLQASVSDGWVAEVDLERDGAGWILDPEQPGMSIMNLLDNEWKELFYSRDDTGIPRAWIHRMQAAQKLGESFGASHMLQQYRQQLYQR